MNTEKPLSLPNTSRFLQLLALLTLASLCALGGQTTAGVSATADITAELPPHHNIPDTINSAVDALEISGQYPCPWSTHWQTGGCVTVTTPKIPVSLLRDNPFDLWHKTFDVSDIRTVSYFCPGAFPYPFEGAFSGNPEWIDSSYHVSASVQAVESSGNKDHTPTYSYAGFDALDPGVVTVHSSLWPKADAYIAGTYMCSNSPASPL